MSEQQISFQQLTIKEWQQFDCIDLAFHDRLTILTGANGSGKTTILKLLAQHHDRWQFHTVSTPKKDLRTGTMNFCPRLFHGEDKSHDLDIGEIIYTNRKSSSLSILDSGAKEYSVEISSWQSIELIFIPSHRSVFRYESIMELPVGKKEKRQSFNEINNLDKQHYQQVSLGQLHKHSGSFFMKRDLIAWAIQGYGIKNGAEEIIMNVNPSN
jgi:ABC-type cobalamin/Fe3+-siderophores transport system ATPase subunit